jgi:hypothetical protein
MKHRLQQLRAVVACIRHLCLHVYAVGSACQSSTLLYQASICSCSCTCCVARVVRYAADSERGTF